MKFSPSAYLAQKLPRCYCYTSPYCEVCRNALRSLHIGKTWKICVPDGATTSVAPRYTRNRKALAIVMASKTGNVGALLENEKPPRDRKEKIKRIRELIKQKHLPAWLDPTYKRRPPQNLLSQFENRECVVNHNKRAQDLIDFRAWYEAKYGPRCAVKREIRREKEAGKRAIRENELNYSDRQKELQQHLRNQYAEENRLGAERELGKPSDLDVMKAKAQVLRGKHQRAEKEYVDQAYGKVWRNSMGAEAIRNYDHLLHKKQATKDLGEQILFNLLDELEDQEIDDYYHKLGLDSAAKEKAQLEKEAVYQKQLDMQAQEAVVAQIRDRLVKKSQDHENKLQAQQERLLQEEKLRFESFKEQYDDHMKKQKTREFLSQQHKNSNVEQEQLERILKEKQKREEWERQAGLEKTEQLRKVAEKKAIWYRRHLSEMNYNQKLMGVAQNNAAEKYAEDFARQQHHDALWTFTNNLKDRQGLQRRVNAELENQTRARETEKKQIEAKKLKERELEKQEAALYAERQKGIEEARYREAQKNAQVILFQTLEKKDREKRQADAIRTFHKEQQAKRVEEDAHVKRLAESMLAAM